MRVFLITTYLLICPVLVFAQDIVVDGDGTLVQNQPIKIDPKKIAKLCEDLNNQTQQLVTNVNIAQQGVDDAQKAVDTAQAKEEKCLETVQTIQSVIDGKINVSDVNWYDGQEYSRVNWAEGMQ